MSLEGSTPSPSALKHHVPLAERQRRQPSKLDRRVQLPQGILGDRLMVGCLPLKQATEVRILLPEPFGNREAQIADNTAGWLLLVATPGSDPGGRWFDSNSRNSTEVIRPDEEPVLKTGGGIPLVGSSPTASADMGSWSNRKTPVLQTGPVEIRQGRVRFPVSPLFKTTRSRGPAAKTPGLHPGNDGSSPSGIIRECGPGTPTAERLGSGTAAKSGGRE